MLRGRCGLRGMTVAWLGLVAAIAVVILLGFWPAGAFSQGDRPSPGAPLLPPRHNPLALRRLTGATSAECRISSTFWLPGETFIAVSSAGTFRTSPCSSSPGNAAFGRRMDTQPAL